LNTQPNLRTERCLVIFDVHEDVAWVRRVLAREHGNFSHLVLGGDYFDSRRTPDGGGVPKMCALLKELRDSLGERLTVLLGNHDVTYAESTSKGLRLRPLRMDRLKHHCSGFTVSKAMRIRNELDSNFWAGTRLFQAVNGCLVSHAGVSPFFWREELAVEEALAALDAQCAIAWQYLGAYPAAILGAGTARGGDQPHGGILWQDFDDEFEDALPLPQIVGHTQGAGPRQKGRSWCLDGARTCYGVLSADGTLEVRTA
jgi:hypothetical protein